MPCASCGKSGSRCCLCNQSSNKWFPWGSKRKVCWRCRKKQFLLIEEREKANKKVRMLMEGRGE